MANAIVIQDNGEANKVELRGGTGLLDANSIREHIGAYGSPVEKPFSLGGTEYAACYTAGTGSNDVGNKFMNRVGGQGNVLGPMVIVRYREGLLYGLERDDFPRLEQVIELSGGTIK